MCVCHMNQATVGQFVVTYRIISCNIRSVDAVIGVGRAFH